MATTTVKTKVWGKTYNIGDELPDYGSLRLVNSNNGVLEIEGLSADASKLPTWCKQGSQVFFLDTKKVKKFNESDTAWYELN